MTTNNETNTNKPSVGIKAWGTVAPDVNQKKFVKRDEEVLPRLKYLKFTQQCTDVRLISELGVYYSCRVSLPKCKSPFGDIIRSAWPVYEDCPLKNEAKLEPKKRYIVLAIDRTDDLVKIFDMAPTIYSKIDATLTAKNKRRADDDHVSPLNFDISILYSKDAPPTDKYNVVGQDSEPCLSQKDKDLIIAQLGSMDMIDKILAKQLIIPKGDTVRKNLNSLGWDGGPILKKKEEKEEKADTKTKLAEATDDDYDFTKATVVEGTQEESTDAAE
jgi:hypothetical protein